jgi:hypothetical protein
MQRLCAALLVCSLATPAFAAQPSMCPTDGDRATLHAFAEKLARAHDVDEAKDMAMKKLRFGDKALDAAESLTSDSEGLAEARAKFEAFEGTVLAASTTEEVAGAFDSLAVQNQTMACDYTTVELVLIVLGFLFFIIPGIIFLIIFC